MPLSRREIGVQETTFAGLPCCRITTAQGRATSCLCGKHTDKTTKVQNCLLLAYGVRWRGQPGISIADLYQVGCVRLMLRSRMGAIAMRLPQF
jgi:hypothetical protein